MLNLREKLGGFLNQTKQSISESLNEVRANASDAAAAGAYVVGKTLMKAGPLGAAVGGTMAAASETKPTVADGAPSDEEINALENQNQQNIARLSGYGSDQYGNRTYRLPLDERLKIAQESPDTISELLSEEEQKLITVTEKEDPSLLAKASRVISGGPKEKEVKIPDIREVRVVGVPEIKPEDIKRTPEFYPESFRKRLVEIAKEEGKDVGNLSAQLETEMGWFEPNYIKTDEGAVGQGQHRDIFFNEWNPVFKERFGRDYDRTKPEDVFRVTAIAMKELEEQFGSWEGALVAYNKGGSVAQAYIDDPNLTFDDDPYVKSVKEKLKKYNQ